MVPLTGEAGEPVDCVTTSRLRLPLVTPEDAAGMLAGRRRISWHPDYPGAGDRDLAALAADPPHGWGPRHVVRAGDGATIGCAGLVGPPEAAEDGVTEVEAVVRLVEDARGHGAAREALAGLLAEADRLGVRVRAAVRPDDPAAMRLVSRAGFTGLRGSREGGELVMVRPLPGTAAIPPPAPARRPARRPAQGRAATPRLVATDLDGTLLRNDGTVSPRTAAALARAHEVGLPVVFVTGRPLRWAAQVFEHVGRHGLVIVANGALVWDVGAGEPRLQRTIAPDDVAAVVRAVRAEFADASFAVERLEGFAVEHTYRPQHELAPDVRREAVAELASQPVQKLLVRNPGVLADDYAPRVQQLAGERVEVTFSNGDDLLEISAAGVTKASTLALLCEELGVKPGEVVALGDMPNDVAMLRWAGTSYAMAQAHPLAAEAATRTAGSNDDDGVAEVIERILAEDVETGSAAPSQG
ncbi:Cof-type HAD-IIB family hydrolase [Nocardioides aequoreus]|uniref:Cof-type HAD-IIB family hydrolase n=1 Tax=Nocardioides aequoreus TaxID=397278 RepID=UPI000A015EFB|nr:Cof-type HAD-IIB family hydrolase [Nocardioides aequoreus]